MPERMAEWSSHFGERAGVDTVETWRRIIRTFEDIDGGWWDVAVSAGSYGEQQLIFAARGDIEFRACELESHGHFEAEQMLLRLSDPELRKLLAQAPRWQPE